MKQLIRKTLLVLLGGVLCSSAWATGFSTIVGATDNSDASWTNYSEAYAIEANKTLHLEFVNNHATNAECVSNNWGIIDSSDPMFRNWFNYVLILSSDESHASQYFFVRPDNWGDGTKYDASGNESNWDWSNFETETNGATVSMDIIRRGSVVTVIANLKSTTGVYRFQKYSMDIAESEATVYAQLTVEHAHIIINDEVTTVYDSDFEYTNDFTSAEKLSFAGETSAASIVTDDTFGFAFQNTKSASARSNYLVLPDHLLSHSAATKQLSIGFWVKATEANAGLSHDYPWAPIFTAYAAAPGTENTFPMFACEYRGVLQVNCVSGWCNYVDAQNTTGTNKLYHTTWNGSADVPGNGGADWLADHDWHYYTVVLDNETASVYIDGELKNQWTATINYNDGENDITGTTQKGLFLNGSVLKYICLGGNQAWNWGDPDPGFTFARFILKNSAMTAAQITEQMAADKAKFNVKIGNTKWATLASDQILNFEGTGITANIVSDFNDTKKTITVSPLTEVPAGTPILVNGDAGVYSVPVLTSTSAIVGTNYLVRGTGADVTAATGTATRFVMVASGTDAVFKKIGSNSPTISTSKAYLEIPAVVSAHELTMAFNDDDVTAIKNIKVGSEDNVYYNLNGQRVLYPTKGLYIVNGKKVIIK